MRQWLAIGILVGSGMLGPATTAAADVCQGPLLGAGFLAEGGLMLVDIATAPASARRYNERQLTVEPVLDLRSKTWGAKASYSFGGNGAARARSVAYDRMTGRKRGHRSPSAAAALSFAATAVPLGVGFLLGEEHADAGARLAAAGIVLGPSVGHLYAGAPARAAIMSAARFGVGYGTLRVWGHCSD